MLSESRTIQDRNTLFSATIGTYAVGAYHPEYGWAVQQINVTANDVGKTKPIVLCLRPVAENWTDNNGTMYKELTSWPLMTSLTPDKSKIASLNIESAESPMDSGLYLINEFILQDQSTKVGEVYSTQGLTTQLTLKYTSSINTMASFNAGPLSVQGSIESSDSTAPSLASISNGASRAIYATIDYEYQHWWISPFGPDYEIWRVYHVDAGSAVYSLTEFPTPQFKALSQKDDTFDARDTPSYQTKTITKDFNRYSGAGWSVGVSASLTAGWDLFQGAVGVGGTFGLSSSSGGEAAYTYQVQGGRRIYVDAWNLPGSSASGIVLTYKNVFWATNATGGWLSGSGDTYNAASIIGVNGEPIGTPYAQIYAPTSGSAAYIKVTLNAATVGRIFVYGYSQSGYTGGHLYTFVSNDNQNWTPVGTVTLSNTNPDFIDCGSYYSSNFRYISFSGYDDNNHPISLYLDAVHVV